MAMELNADNTATHVANIIRELEVEAVAEALCDVILEQPSVNQIEAAAGDGGCLGRPQEEATNVAECSVDANSGVRHSGTVAEGGEHLYTVKPSIELKEGPYVYNMKSNPRGYCIMINNYEFLPEYVITRHGSLSEAEYLSKIFTQLGYEVIGFENLSAEKMLHVFCDIAKDPKLHKHDSLVVVILTHGDRGLLMGSDGFFAGVETIVGMFNNHNCGALINKPKMFFIQACRGDAYDYGVVDPSSAADAVPRPSPVADTGVPILPTATDTLICYSTVEGYVSLRNETTGSWFGDAIGKVFVDHACDEDIETLLKRVNNRMLRRESLMVDRVKQALEVVMRGWRKQLYFNPGIFEA